MRPLQFEAPQSTRSPGVMPLVQWPQAEEKIWKFLVYEIVAIEQPGKNLKHMTRT